MAKIFYLGANIWPETLDLINQTKSSALFYEEQFINQAGSEIKSLIQSDRAISIDKHNILDFLERAKDTFHPEREIIQEKIINDFRSFFLRMRFLRFDISGAYEGSSYFLDLVDFALYVKSKFSITDVFCSLTPHSLESWIIIRSLELSGANVLRLIDSPLPWIQLPIMGLDNQKNPIINKKNGMVKGSWLTKYLAKLRGDYNTAIPYYEKDAPKSVIKTLISEHRKIRPLHLILKLVEKRLVFEEFSKYKSNVSMADNYGIYFLHAQPEMNTLPEAGFYCDQYLAVKKISEAMPSNAKLLIKEHPSTLSRVCDRRWRPKGFYKRFTSLPNTQLCPENKDPFALIDNANFVASIAGVCLTEALARGVPIIAFHSARFAFFDPEFCIDANIYSILELKKAISEIFQKKRKVDSEKLVKSFNKIMEYGYDGGTQETYLPNSIWQATANARRATFLAMNDFISKQ